MTVGDGGESAHPGREAGPDGAPVAGRLRIGLAQLDSALGDVEANFARAAGAMAEAAAGGAGLVVFPELFLTGYWVTGLDVDASDLALRAGDPRLAALTSEGGPDAVVGFIEEGRRFNAFNSAAYLSGGGLVHVHRKNYLVTYGPFEEGKYFTPGNAMRAFDTRHGRVAILVCNDLWQPPLAFLAVEDGAKVLIVPANSTESQFDEVADTKRYWRDITRFYAQLFQCYVIFVNRVGCESRTRFWGGSHVLDPWGTTVAEAPNYAEELLFADIDLREVRRRRRQFPFLKESRLEHLTREFQRLLAEEKDG